MNIYRMYLRDKANVDGLWGWIYKNNIDEVRKIESTLNAKFGGGVSCDLVEGLVLEVRMSISAKEFPKYYESVKCLSMYIDIYPWINEVAVEFVGWRLEDEPMRCVLTG